MSTAELVLKLDQLRLTIRKRDEAIRIAATIKGLEEQCLDIQREITKELERLDVVQRGNFGWENRTLSFLMSIVRHCDGEKS